MPSNTPLLHVAVLIDSDNTQLSYTQNILKLAKRYGLITVCCAYGDWKQSLLSRHREKLLALNVKLVQQDAIGKNATDHRLLIEAGEIIGVYDIDVFVIVSSDGDFTVLCQHIQEKKKRVIGIGSKNRISKTEALQKACTEFFYVEEL